MPKNVTRTGIRNRDLIYTQLDRWAEEEGRGLSEDASAGFVCQTERHDHQDNEPILARFSGIHSGIASAGRPNGCIAEHDAGVAGKGKERA